MYKPPFRYDEKEQRIFDADGHELLQMRGWSYLSKNMSPNAAVEIQDHYGEMIVSLLNDERITVFTTGKKS